MEPVDVESRTPPPPPPPPVRPAGESPTTVLPGTEPAPFAAPTVTPAASAPAHTPTSATGPRPAPPTTPVMLPTAVWRLCAAAAVVASFAAMGWQTLRMLDGEPWSSTIMAASAAAAVVSAVCVLVWTWCVSENARRLVGPMATVPPPDPWSNVVAWLVPFGFVAIALAVVAALGSGLDADDAGLSTPLLVAVATLLLAIPLTYRPVHRLAAAVRQVGGYSAHLSAWMWVPVVLAIVAAVTLVALRLGVVDDSAGGDDASWAPLWVVAVAAIVPCVVVVALAWRAGESVEEAITVAARRRRGAELVQRTKPLRRPRMVRRDRVELLPGTGLLRLGIVSLIAGLALLSLVGAIVMLLFWMEGNERTLSPDQQDRAWDAMSALHSGARAVAFAVIALVAVWTAVTVVNVRRSSGRRRNPVLAAAAWPLAGVGIWVIADRLVVDQPIATVVAGFALQSLVLFVPFALLERAADAVDARRTPLRISYVFGVVLLVHIQGFGGLSTIESTSDSTEYLRFAGYLALGALVQLLSTLAITDACRSLASSTEHEAAHHNALVDQRARVAAATPSHEEAR